MQRPHLASALAIAAFGLLALGSGKGSGGAGPSGSGSAATTATAEKAAGKPTLLATCNKPKEGTCDEYYGMVPTLVPDMCKDDSGEFKKGGDECPKANLIGTCHYKKTSSDGPGQYANIYANNKMNAEAAKKDCLDSNADNHKEWLEAPAAAKAVASAAGTATTTGAASGSGAAKATSTGSKTAPSASGAAKGTAAASGTAKPAGSGSKPVAK